MPFEGKGITSCKGIACATAGLSHQVTLRAVTELVMIFSFKEKNIAQVNQDTFSVLYFALY